MAKSHQNLEIIRSDWVEALRERDIDRAIARLAPDVSWQGVKPHLICWDREHVAQTLEGWRTRRHPRVDSLELIEVGDAVVLSVTGPDFRRAGDVALDGEIHMVFRLRDGQITRIHDYRRRADALAAAAAPPSPLPEREGVRDLGPPPPGSARVAGLTPFVRVADVARSAGFYRLLGFAVRDTFVPGITIQWAFLEATNEARIMLERDQRPVDPDAQGVLFYLFSRNLAGLREHLLAHGVAAGEIEDGSPGPSQEMRVIDPDGYVLMIAQIEEPPVDG
jgi:ketosteroid isomerase-like protein